MHTLIIWQQIPESTILFLVPSEKAKEWEDFIKDANDKLMNNDDECDGLQFMNVATCDAQYSEDSVDWGKYGGVLLPYIVYPKEIEGKIITSVCLTGVVL